MNNRIITFLGFAVLTATLVSAQPPFGGDRGGGDRGGDRGGGDRGGGDRGGSRGGFDPSSFLDRLDANGNGVLDPDEQQGPASFLIGRLQQTDPSIVSGRPIPIAKIKEGFEKMRGGSSVSTDPRSSGASSQAAGDAALMAELLVPGFGDELAPMPLMGFGPKAEMLAVPVTDADRNEAGESMRRYDRNRDGFIAKDELSSRMSGNPLDFDRNRDGKLSLDELAVRYARKREGEEDAKKQKDKAKVPAKTTSAEVVDVFNGRKSYRLTDGRKPPEGLPGFFIDKDVNGDGQVTMAEFAADWNDETIVQFFDSDFNRDGVITRDEAIRAVENGPASQVMPSTSPSSTTTAPSSTAASASGPAAQVDMSKLDAKFIKVVQRIVDRNDLNKDGALTASEWDKMPMSPAAADFNRDGRVSVDEYTYWMQTRQGKK